jgi:hypothetical protein
MKRSRTTAIPDQLRLFHPSPRVIRWEKLPPDSQEEVIVLLSHLLLGASSKQRGSAEAEEQSDE